LEILWTFLRIPTAAAGYRAFMESIDFVQHGWYVGTFLYCVAAGLLPFLSTEAYLLWMAVTAPRADVLPLLATACVAHMLAKSLVFAAGRGVVRLPGARDHATVEAMQKRMGAGRGSPLLAFVSSLTGFPPFYWFALAAGALRWRFAPFFAAGLAGRVLRFGAVVLLPQGLDVRGLYARVGPTNVLTAAFIGLLVGLHAATWRSSPARRDGGLHPRRALDAVGIGLGVALLWEAVLRLDLTLASARLLLFGLAYVAARASFELVRTRRAAAGGVPASMFAAVRWDRALAWAGSLGLVAWGVQTLQHRPESVERGVALLAAGSLVGWIAAVGGLNPGATVGGREIVRFFRNAVLALLWSLLVAAVTDQYVLMALGSLGFTLATIETYRTLGVLWSPVPPLTPAPPRPHRFAPVFFALWSVLVVHLAWDWTQALELTAGL
jgi:membrane protein YqaA with SNARE-associated domain